QCGAPACRKAAHAPSPKSTPTHHTHSPLRATTSPPACATIRPHGEWGCGHRAAIRGAMRGRNPPRTDMGRLSAIFIAFCMVLIAGSVGVVTFLSFGFTGMEASVIAVAVMTALVMMNSLTSRTRDRYAVGAQIADLSRGTADIARQVSELDRRIVAVE